MPIDWDCCHEKIIGYVNRVLAHDEAIVPVDPGPIEASVRVLWWAKTELWAVIFTLLSLVLAILGTFTEPQQPWLFGVYLFFTPVAAGAVGGLVHRIRTSTSEALPLSARTTVLGMIAGTVSALVFIAAQMITHGEQGAFTRTIPEHFNLLTPFALIIGFVAGLTTDTVFSRLRSQNALSMSQRLLRGNLNNVDGKHQVQEGVRR